MSRESNKKVLPKRESIFDLFEEMMNDFSDKELHDLPVDGAEQHDHYIYGTPKRKV